MPTENQLSIFISHTHSDEKLAYAIREAVRSMFGEDILVRYSTNKELNEGIRPGDDWFRWIGAQVREASLALILLTPSSVQKPWVLWEAGAVAGAALAVDGGNGRKVRPISFGLQSVEIPGPFARDQISNGLNRSDMETFLTDLLDEFSGKLDRQRIVRAGPKLPAALDAYLLAAADALRTAPLLVTEAAIQEWLDRIADLEKEERYSEIDTLHDWLAVAFGRKDEAKQRPLDLRIHRRLGQLYARALQPERAASEFELGRQLAPRDIFLLRNLGTALLDMGQKDRTKAVLEDIRSLDPEAFVRNPENAALMARLYRELGNYSATTDILKEAFARNPESYYLADLLAQSLLPLKEISRAREIYLQALRIIEKLRDINVWVCGTGLTAALAVADEARETRFLQMLIERQPSPKQAATIREGISTVASAFGVEKAKLQKIEHALGFSI